MAQVEPAVRTIAERARQEYLKAANRNDPNLAYYKEQYDLWTLQENVLPRLTTLLKTLCTGYRSKADLAWLEAKADEHALLLRNPG